MKELDVKVTGLQEEVKATQVNIQGVQSGLKQVESKVKKMEDNAMKAVEDNNNVIFEELREREARRLNVVLLGVPEHADQAAPGKDKQVWDRDLCVKICRSLELDFSEEVFKFFRRVGAAEEGPRPLVAGFYTEMERSMLLRRAKKLENTEFKEVRVAPDLTKRQRKEERDLWAESEERNKNRTEEQRSKNLVWAVVGARGEKRLLLQPSRPGTQQVRGTRRGRGRPPLSTRPGRSDGQQQLLHTLRARGGLGGSSRGRTAARPLSSGSEGEESETMGSAAEGESDPVDQETAVPPLSGGSQKRKAGAALEGQPPDKATR